jgi:hypothetical protein
MKNEISELIEDFIKKYLTVEVECQGSKVTVGLYFNGILISRDSDYPLKED